MTSSPFTQTVQSTMPSQTDSDVMIQTINSRFWYFWFFMVIGLPLCLVLIGVPLIALSWTSSCFLHYALWKVVPTHVARTTPGKQLHFRTIRVVFESKDRLCQDVNEITYSRNKRQRQRFSSVAKHSVL